MLLKKNNNKLLLLYDLNFLSFFKKPNNLFTKNLSIGFFQRIFFEKKKKKNLFFFNTFFFNKIFFSFLKHGKKKLFFKFFFNIFSWLKTFYKKCGINLFLKIIFLFKSPIGLKKIKKSGRILLKPFIVPYFHQYKLCIQLLKKSILQRNEYFFLEKMLLELLDILIFRQGNLHKKFLQQLEIAVSERTSFQYRKRWKI